MTNMHKLGAVMSITGAVLATVWFGWKFSLVIILLLWGNNLERAESDKSKE